MESFRRKILKGLITLEEYKNKAIASTIKIFTDAEFEYVKELGDGAFGTVVEIKHPSQATTYAAKIILEEDVTDGESLHWPSLRHENILPLLASKHFKSTYCYAFLMPIYPCTVNQKIYDPGFYSDAKAFDKMVSWLQDVVRGLRYLHDRHLCHADLKSNNVLVSEDDSRAVICDFGYVTLATEGPVKEYGTPFIYRPPECHDGRSWDEVNTPLVPVVEPYKFDVWILGMFAIEMFSAETLLHMALKWRQQPQWSCAIYRTLYSILQAKTFKFLLKEAFPFSTITKSKFTAIHNFLIGCLQLHPQKRPTIAEVSNHILFDGHHLNTITKNDVWSKRANTRKIDFLIGVYNKRAFHKFAAPTKSSNPGHSTSLDPQVSHQREVPAQPINNTNQPENAPKSKKSTKKRSLFQYLFQPCFPMFFQKKRSSNTSFDSR